MMTIWTIYVTTVVAYALHSLASIFMPITIGVSLIYLAVVLVLA